MDEDAALFDWIRHYAAVLSIFVLLGGVAGLLYSRVTSQGVEAWTYVVETGEEIQPRQLGPVAQAIFRSADVYRPAMDELGIDESPLRFLSRAAELRPVPDTPTLIVVGRAGTLARAEEISTVMARALVSAMDNQAGFSEFKVFGRAQPAPVQPGVDRRVAVAIGATTALWFGVAAALIHFRARRPVISLRRASALAGARRWVQVRGRGPSWLGVLRGRPRWRDDGHNEAILAAVASDGDHAVVVTGASREERRSIRARLGDGARQDPSVTDRPRPTAADGAALRTVVVCHAATDARDLALLGDVQGGDVFADGEGLELVWIR